MHMHQNTVILESLRQFSAIIMEHFPSQGINQGRNSDTDNKFDREVWFNFFHCATEFLIQPSLQLNKFTPTKRSLIIKRYDDVRQLMAVEVRRMWFNLGSHKIQFIPELVEPILKMSMLPDMGIRRPTIEIFFDMMRSEYFASSKANFNDFEMEMIHKLDNLIQQGEGDEQYRNLFRQVMTTKCLQGTTEQHTDLRTDVIAFVTKATTLMKKLFEYRSVLHDQNKENLMMCTVQLLEFYAEKKHVEMHVRYLERLFRLHFNSGNHTEAALTLKRVTDLLTWQEAQLSSSLQLSFETTRLLALNLDSVQGRTLTHRQLKEALYEHIINLFDKGKMWESAVKICKELVLQHENETFEYERLGALHLKLFKFYEKIRAEDNLVANGGDKSKGSVHRQSNESYWRVAPSYFRVGFYGKGFMDLLSNKQFIYRGNEMERSEDFLARLQSQHPKAEIMKDLREPGPEVREALVQQIQVVAVKPIPNEFVRQLQEKFVNPKIVDFYKHNNVKSFELRRPVVLEGYSRDDPTALSIAMTVMEVTNALPSILRCTPIESVRQTSLTPLEYAIDIMETTNQDLRDMIVQFSIHPCRDNQTRNGVVQKITGIIDAAVQGGIKRYEDAFFTQAYIDQHQDDVPNIQRLKELIAKQMPLLKDLLDIVSQGQTDEIYSYLKEHFAKMRTDIESKYGKQSNDMLDNIFELRRPLSSYTPLNGANRQSDTSIGSAE